MNSITVLETSEFSLNLEQVKGHVCYLYNGEETRIKLISVEEVFDNANGIKVLNPLQSVFARHYLYGNALVSAPTSAGKSLIALVFLLRQDRSKNFIYMSPTRSLAVQSSHNFRHYFHVRLKLSGYEEELEDDNLSDESNGGGNLIVTTYEAYITALRNRVPWALNVSAIVIDEFHQISFSDRGTQIEEIVAWALLNRASLLCLSATLPGSGDVARWLKATVHIESYWRPVPLERQFVNAYKQEKVTLLRDLILPDEKTIVFVGSKKEGWILLRELYEEGYQVLNKTLPDPLPDKNSSKVVQHCSTVVQESSRVVQCAFHCADIPVEEQRLIETRFKEDPDFRILIATQTLAYGMNLPADHVVIFAGKKFIKDGFKLWPPPSDIIQMEGRAGRLGLKDHGRSSICIVSNPYSHREIKDAIKNFYRGKFTTALTARMSEDKDALYLAVLASMIHTQNPPEFLRETWALRDKYLFYDVFRNELTRMGFIRGGDLSEKGLFSVKSGMTPGRVNKFLSYYRINPASLITLTPVVRDGLSIISTGFLKKEELNWVLTAYPWVMEQIDRVFREFMSVLPDRALTNIFDTVEWSLAAYQSGIFFYKPSLHNLPGSFGRIYQDREYVIKTLLLSRELGLTDYTVEEIETLVSQLESGLPEEWIYLGGLKNIGYFSGHALRLALTACGMRPPEKGESIGDYFDMVGEDNLKKALEVIFKRVGREDRSGQIMKAIEENRTVTSPPEGVFDVKKAVKDDIKKLKVFACNGIKKGRSINSCLCVMRLKD
jgi:helicase